MVSKRCKTYHEKDETPKALFGFNDWPLTIVGVVILGFFIPVVFFQQPVAEAWRCFFKDGIVAIGFTAIFWLGNRAIILFFRKLFPDQRDLGKRLVKQSVVVVLYTFIASMLLGYVEMKLSESDLTTWQHKGLPQMFVVSLASTFFVLTIYEAAYFFFKWKDSIAETERVKKERVSSELEALKNQVNPHFLFNSLNTLASIIPEDPKKAVEFVQKLSSVYRSILDLNSKQVVTLQEELENLEKYIFLMQTRFPENLSVEIKANEESKNCFVVPMCLQNLVENAIKHNVISKKKPLNVVIQTTEEEVSVFNNLQRKITEEQSTGTGLRNIDNRFRLTFGRRIVVEETEHSFGVRLPLVKIEGA